MPECRRYNLTVNRRDFMRSSGRWLVALAGMGTGQATAAPASAAGARAAANRSVTLFLAGDVMTGRGIDQVLPHPGDSKIHESYMKDALGYVEIAEEANGPIQRPADFDYVWGDALGVLDELAPDLRIINLETSVTTSDDFRPRKGIHYRMHPNNTPVISAAGIDCCVLANNHVLDWGYAGLAETLDTLHRAGLQTAGAGRDLENAMEPAVFELGDNRRVMVFGAASPSSGVPSAWAAAQDRAGVNYIADYSAASVKRIADHVRAVKRPGDIAVLSIHWGGNWGYHVPPKLREFARGLIDQAAVDVIHGHSSHHPRGIEVYRGRPIIYGCGDLVNDYEGIGGREEYRGDLSLMYFVSLDVASGELTRLNMVSMRMRRFRLNRASAAEAGWMAATLDRESRPFGSRVDLASDRSLSLGWGNAAGDAAPASH
jgi:poly-gamma-glutamate synthesis protein (capsule biosynthesis protein)